jgi:ubiquinone/menaquinone biosynthesis C-methylase UbiE
MASVRERVDAAVFDFLGRRFDNHFVPARRALLAHTRGRVLEIGSGTGFSIQHYPPGLEELVLTEPGPLLLARARRRAAELRREVTFVEAPAERLPFEDDAFDTVVSMLVLCSVPDQLRALREIRRVLKPDGRFLFVEHVRSDDPGIARWQDRLERPWGVVAMGCHPNRRTLEAIETAGFELEHLERGRLPKSAPIVRPMVTGRARISQERVRGPAADAV